MTAPAVQRYRKRRGERLEVGIEKTLHELLHQAVAASGKTLSDFVQDAIATKLRNWSPPADYINVQREKVGKAPASLFDPAVFDALGFPRGLHPDNPIAEINYVVAKGPDAVRKLLRQWWRTNGLNPDDYTEAMLQETLRVHASSKSKPKPKPKAEAEV